MKKNPIFFDIETGGLESRGERASSVLSISSQQSGIAQEIFSHPKPGTWLSQFSKESVLPQVTAASQTVSEKQGIQSFINTLRASPGAPLVGYNSHNFDIPFLSQRAKHYGLQDEFLGAMRGRRQIDIGLRIKSATAQAMQEHIERGTFASELGGRTWGQATVDWGKLPYDQRPPEFKMLAQIKGLAEQVDQDPVRAGTKQARGWKLEQIYGLFEPDSDLVKKAHQSTADTEMTRRLFEALGSGELQEKMAQPEFAKGWLKTTVEGLNKTKDTAAGEFYHPNFKTRLQTGIQSVPKGIRKLGAGAAMIGVGIAAIGIVNNAFSGKDDEYNTVEGLRHGGLAQSLRKERTPFGSGYKGNNWEVDNEEAGFQLLRTGSISAVGLTGAAMAVPAINNHWKDYKRFRYSLAKNPIKSFNTWSDIAEDFKEAKASFLHPTPGQLDDSVATDRGRHHGPIAPPDKRINPLKKTRAAGVKAFKAYSEAVGRDPKQFARSIGTGVASAGLLGGALALAGIGTAASLYSYAKGDENAGEAGHAAYKASFGFAATGAAVGAVSAGFAHASYKEGSPKFANVDKLLNIKASQKLKVGGGLALAATGALGLGLGLSHSLSAGRRESDNFESWGITEALGAPGIASMAAVSASIGTLSLIPGMTRLAETAPSVIKNSEIYNKSQKIDIGGLGSKIKDFANKTKSLSVDMGSIINSNASLKKYALGGMVATGLGIATAQGLSEPDAPILSALSVLPSASLLGLGGGVAAYGLTNTKDFSKTVGSLYSATAPARDLIGSGIKNIPSAAKSAYGTYTDVLKGMGVSGIGRAGHAADLIGKAGIAGGGLISAVGLGYGVLSAFSGSHESAASEFSQKLSDIGSSIAAPATMLALAAQVPIGYDSFRELEAGKTIKGRPDWLNEKLNKSNKTIKGIFDRLIPEKFEPTGSTSGNIKQVAKMRKWIPIAAALHVGIASFSPEKTYKVPEKNTAPNRFSGKDDAHNTVEGLNHKGVSQQMRKDRTPFGSGWDALRALRKSKETYQQMIKSREFQKSLSSAVPIGGTTHGGFGAATQMQSTFRGQEFKFIRKSGLIGKEETAVMRKFQDDFAPTPYSEARYTGKKVIQDGIEKGDEFTFDMEMFEGQEFSTILKEGGQLNKGAINQYQSALTKMEKAGIVHGDAHGGNVFLTKQGQVGLIDYGTSGKAGTSFEILDNFSGSRDLGVMAPGGGIRRVLQERRMGLEHPQHGFGFYSKRDPKVDQVAIELMRNRASLPMQSNVSVNPLGTTRIKQSMAAPGEPSYMDVFTNNRQIDSNSDMNSLLAALDSAKSAKSDSLMNTANLRMQHKQKVQSKKIATANSQKTAIARIYKNGSDGGRRSRQG